MRPTRPQVVPMIRRYYNRPGNENGGALHIVLEDLNVNDSHVEFCIQWATENEDWSGARLGRVLRAMTKTQRLKLARTGFNPPSPIHTRTV